MPHLDKYLTHSLHDSLSFLVKVPSREFEKLAVVVIGELTRCQSEDVKEWYSVENDLVND